MQQVATSDHRHIQLAQEVIAGTVESGYVTPSSQTSDLKDDGILMEPTSRTSGAWGCTGLIRLQQPIPTSQLVAMVFGNYLITHMPEDCIVSGFTTSDSTNIVDIVSISDNESSDYGPVYLTSDDENAGFPIIRETTGSGSWSETESSDETEGCQTTSEEASQSVAPQGISLQQVMMTEPEGTSTSATTQMPPESIATTIAGLPASGAQTAMM